MKFLLLIRVDPDIVPAPEDTDPTPWWEGANKEGQWLAGGPLESAATATTVRVRDGQTLITDGPFAEYKEHIGGFDVIDAPDVEAAIELAKGHPVTGFGAVEVRELHGTGPSAAELDEMFAAARVDARDGLRRYLFVHAEAEPGATIPPHEGIMEAWLDEFEPTGALIVGHQLASSRSAATVRRRDGQTLVTRGPYAELAEQVAGFDLVDVANLDDALAIAAKHPTTLFSAIEIRPVGSF
jgi:hypothetical protein